mmetsp:Transcript_59778/g.88669  ORF Transcript_59778/g.88669 Transcript_59778/m.88669 type:complete len:393 (+) Transcript_59778:832-2010(+)
MVLRPLACDDKKTQREVFTKLTMILVQEGARSVGAVGVSQLPRRRRQVRRPPTVHEGIFHRIILKLKSRIEQQRLLPPCLSVDRVAEYGGGRGLDVLSLLDGAGRVIELGGDREDGAWVVGALGRVNRGVEPELVAGSLVTRQLGEVGAVVHGDHGDAAVDVGERNDRVGHEVGIRLHPRDVHLGIFDEAAQSVRGDAHGDRTAHARRLVVVLDGIDLKGDFVHLRLHLHCPQDVPIPIGQGSDSLRHSPRHPLNHPHVGRASPWTIQFLDGQVLGHARLEVHEPIPLGQREGTPPTGVVAGRERASATGHVRVLKAGVGVTAEELPVGGQAGASGGGCVHLALDPGCKVGGAGGTSGGQRVDGGQGRTEGGLLKEARRLRPVFAQQSEECR